MIEDERNNRRENKYQRRHQTSNLPAIKQLEDFDFEFQPSIDKKTISDIATCGFIKSGGNVVLIGDLGTGKTHLSISFALKALLKEYSVYFSTVSDMLHELHVARADNTFAKKLKKLINCDLLILDELVIQANTKILYSLKGRYGVPSVFQISHSSHKHHIVFNNNHL